MYFANLTSQGQLSIPSKLRRKYNLDKNRGVVITDGNGKIHVEPAKDTSELAGSLHKYAKKNMTIDKIIALEKKAAAEGAVERYKRSLKRSSSKLLIIDPNKNISK